MSQKKQALPATVVKAGQLIEANDAVRAALPLLYPGQDGLVYTSLPTTTESESNAVRRILACPMVRLVDVVGRIIPVKHLVVSAGEEEKADTGELIDLVRTVLISDRGEVFSSPSKFVRKALRVVCARRGLPPWEPAEYLEVARFPSRDPDKADWLTLIPPASPPTFTPES